MLTAGAPNQQRGVFNKLSNRRVLQTGGWGRAGVAIDAHEGPQWVDCGPSCIERKSAAVGGKRSFGRAMVNGRFAPSTGGGDMLVHVDRAGRLTALMLLARLTSHLCAH